MDHGEMSTGTRDEHYNLVSVLYHALHGAANCERYAFDAQAAGDKDLIVFFQEARGAQALLAERAKGLLGIGGTTPREITEGFAAGGAAGGAAVGSGVLTSGGAPGDSPPGSADVQQGERAVNDVPDEPPNVPSPEDVPPTTGAAPGTGPPPDEDLAAETGDVAPEAPAEGEDAVSPAGEPRRAVPPDAPRTQDPPPRTGDAPPSPSEQPTR